MDPGHHPDLIQGLFALRNAEERPFGNLLAIEVAPTLKLQNPIYTVAQWFLRSKDLYYYGKPKNLMAAFAGYYDRFSVALPGIPREAYVEYKPTRENIEKQALRYLDIPEEEIKVMELRILKQKLDRTFDQYQIEDAAYGVLVLVDLLTNINAFRRIVDTWTDDLLEIFKIDHDLEWKVDYMYEYGNWAVPWLYSDKDLRIDEANLLEDLVKFNLEESEESDSDF